jgi:hypothetical protein
VAARIGMRGKRWNTPSIREPSSPSAGVPDDTWISSSLSLCCYHLPNGSTWLEANPLYDHAIRYEWLTFNPIRRVRTSSKCLRDKEVLTPEEFERLAEQLSVRDRAMVLLAGSAGLDRSEMIALT